MCVCIQHPHLECVLHTQLDTKLQHYYEVLAEKLSADVAQTVVWEGAAKIPIIKSILETVLDNEGNMVCINT